MSDPGSANTNAIVIAANNPPSSDLCQRAPLASKPLRINRVSSRFHSRRAADSGLPSPAEDHIESRIDLNE